MALSLRPQHLKRYGDLARLLIKYGRSDLVRAAKLDDALPEEEAFEAREVPPEAEELAADLERMGPTFIKLGQLLSSRPDLIPAEYPEALSRLQDRVEPFPFEEVERIVSVELGVRISRAFAEFNPRPMGAASLGQVHQAVLRDGRPVVVKVQRPGIQQVITEDLEALQEIAGFAEAHTEFGKAYAVEDIFGQFRQSLLRELDYRLEAQNLSVLAENLREYERIVVPEPVERFTTARVLTMDFIRGRKITSLSPLARLEMDGEALADELFRAHLNQILVDGFFHADPHPGNVFLTADGRIALLDLGMVGRLTPSMQEDLLKLVLAVSEGRGDEVATVAIRTGEPREHFDERKYRRAIADLVAAQQGATASPIEVGKILLAISREAGEAGIRPSPELSLLGKALLNLDQVGRTLDPEFDPNAAIRRHAAEIMRRRMLKAASPANVFSSLLEMNELMQTLPGRVNQVLDNVASNKLEVRVRVPEEVWMLEGLQKIANRITLGLLLAALIIGAAMLMRVETTFRILGYPGLAMLFFLMAAIGALLLAYSIVRDDRHVNGKARRRG
ncbi:AarF/UbiB family protein [soil metagenome]